MKLRNVNIRILGTGISNICQACVSIYDSCGNLVYEGLTCNGCISIELKMYKGYIIIIKSYAGVRKEIFYVDTCTTCYAFRAYEVNRPEEDLVTFLLTDLNYENLPIQKGEIILWQNQ